MRYTRVEFAGFAVAAAQELNSFTFAAVGSGTTLENLQSVMGLDDSFEWFGGTVNGRYLVSYESGDDHFDAAEGYRGKNQFLIAFQSTRGDPAGVDPQGFEVDGCAGGGMHPARGGLGGIVEPVQHAGVRELHRRRERRPPQHRHERRRRDGASPRDGWHLHQRSRRALAASRHQRARFDDVQS